MCCVVWNSSSPVKNIYDHRASELALQACLFVSITQEPGPVVVPPFEATGLNNDIWADVHKAMAEVAVVLNSTNRNQSEKQASSSTAKRQTGVGH